MTITTANAALPYPPSEYSTEYMNRLVRQLSIALTKIESIGPIICGSDLSNQVGHPISGLSIIHVPTSPTNLPSGSVWSDGGTLKIVS